MKSVRIGRKLNLTLFVLLFTVIALHPTITLADLDTIPAWISSDAEFTVSSAWGDADGDGDLDLVVGNNSTANRLYINEGKDEAGNPVFSSQLIGTEERHTQSVAWGDVDGDGDLDLAVGNRFTTNELYVNEGMDEDGNIVFASQPIGTESVSTASVAWGDANGDGYLDLAVGNNFAFSQLYINRGDSTQFFAEDDAQPIGTESYSTQEIAWGDVTGDGLLDLVVGNSSEINLLYVNRRSAADGIIFPESEDIGTAADDTRTVALGDVNGDDFLDLVVGNQGVDYLVLNDGEGTLAIVQEVGDQESEEGAFSRAVALVDADGDGDLDLTVGGVNFKRIYINRSSSSDNDTIFPSSEEIGTGEGNVYDVAWGDMDGDGDLDLAISNYRSANQIYVNRGNNPFGSGGLFLGSSVDDIPLGDEPLQASSRSKRLEQPYATAWGDSNGDGNLDLAVVTDEDVLKIYVNQWPTGQFDVTEIALEPDVADADIAWGDADGDGDLDLAVMTHALKPNEALETYNTITMLYVNENGQFVPREMSGLQEYLRSWAIAWGDADGDGDLDLAVANDSTLNQLYLNDGSGSFAVQTIGANTWNTRSVAWGDADGDGDLDLAVGNNERVNQLYVNVGVNGEVLFVPQEISPDARSTTAVAWGDADGDGDLDLAVGNDDDVNQLYLNLGGNQFSVRPVRADVERTEHIAWGDADGDGDLDLAVGNREGSGQLYRNEGNAVFLIEGISAGTEVSWADADRDGDLDLADGRQLFFNDNDPTSASSNEASRIAINIPNQGEFYATQVIKSETIPIEYALYDRESDVVGRVAFFYSLDGGGQWRPAIPTTDTITTTLATLPYPSTTETNTHTFDWDVSASGLFGQSDNVVLRAVAYPQIVEGTADTGILYTDQTPDLLRPSASTTTFPLRVRGTQVRVVDESDDETTFVNDALIYRQTAGQTQYELMGTGSEAFSTNAQGYLSGRGAVNSGDQIIALRPITSTTAYTLYHTSEAVSSIITAPYTLDMGGVHTLTVSADNQLLLFDLTVSLEWDARNDMAFLAQLDSDLKRTSEIVYDLTNGQAALGIITVYHEREQWNYADIIIQASNNVRPSAIAGGIVPRVVLEPFERIVTNTLTSPNGTVFLPESTIVVNTPYIITQTETFTNTYVPGQVRMGPTWNRFGELDGTIGEDWPRTLAHELGHYLFFLPDNYLGVDSNTGLLKFTDCQGSVMSNPYSDGDSEFLSDDGWDGDCLDTLADEYLRRTDWETIERFYPIKYRGENPGPAVLPINLTQVTFVEDDSPAESLQDTFFELADTDGNSYRVFGGRGEAFLIKTQADDNARNDYVQALGSPIGNQIQARGVETGDELCVYDYGREIVYTGCLIVGEYTEPVVLTAVPNWEPNVTVTQLNPQTFAITVTNVFSESEMTVQIISALGSQSNRTPSLASHVFTMTQTATGEFTRTINLYDPAFSGYVRIAVPDSNKQLIVEFLSTQDRINGDTVSSNIVPEWGADYIEWGADYIEWGADYIEWGADYIEWGADYIEWGADYIEWGASSISWSATATEWRVSTISGDGQVMLFPDNPFGTVPSITLQKLIFPPDLPVWLTPVGQAYQVSGETPDGSIIFRYLGRDVDRVHENDLAVYFTNDNGVSWERLETQVDAGRNHAIASATDQGVYVLAVTFAVSALQPGWNNIGQPTQPTGLLIDDYVMTYQIPITEAIASIDESITAVAWLNDSTLSNTKADEWKFYYPDVVPPFAPLVNDLKGMMVDAYWIHATESVTWYVGVEDPPSHSLSSNINERTARNRSTPYRPPATYYGWITSTQSIASGTIVEAKIGNEICGSGETTLIEGRPAYMIRVNTTAPYPCAIPEGVVDFEVAVEGTVVTFEIDGEITTLVEWDNRVAHFLPITLIPTAVDMITTQSFVGDGRVVFVLLSIMLGLSTLLVLHRRRAI